MKKSYDYSKGIYVHERPGAAVLTNEVQLGLVSPARIGKYMKWAASGDMLWHRAAEMIIPDCHGPGVIKKLIHWLDTGDEIIRRSAAIGLMHQPADRGLHTTIRKSLNEDPDSIVKYRLIQALARHGTPDEVPLLKEFFNMPVPPSPDDVC